MGKLKERFSQFVRVPMPTPTQDPLVWLRNLIRVLETNFRNIEASISNLKRDLKYADTEYLEFDLGSYFPGLPGYIDSSGEVSTCFASTPATCHGFIVLGDSAIDSNATAAEFVTRGLVTYTNAFTVGAELYISTAGGFTATAPSGSGETVRKVGYALSTTEIWFEPSPEYTDIP